MDSEMADQEGPAGSKYQVFLSFRGPDTRQGFTDILFKCLKDIGIVHVFKDDEELEVGHEIGMDLYRGMEESSIYIPIFSKTYASSKWCLREVAYMVEDRRKSKGSKEIMPIFYDVSPDDVKLKSELYSNALSKHKEKPEIVQQWKEALQGVGKIKGWEVKKQGYAKFCESVARDISLKLKVKHRQVTSYLVGIEGQERAVMELLDEEDAHNLWIGIHGMGGIGKTTLAKVVFNKLCESFEGCSFLSDIREVSERYGLLHLQRQLLRNLGHGSLLLDSSDDWVSAVKDLFGRKKVLIVLDDVDDIEQLERLVGNSIRFGMGSRIIITTRDVMSLKLRGKEIKHFKMQELDEEHALRLFSWHAFDRDSPPQSYLPLSERVVSFTGGLPLALEIIGSLLNGKCSSEWRRIIEELQEIPEGKVQDKLKISYKRLDGRAKVIFLDIACFFVGEKKTNAMYMWNACKLFPDNKVDMLVSLSLLRIVDDKFWMHDQIRDFGREIVVAEDFEDPIERSRVWVHEEALSVLKNKKEGKEKIKALRLSNTDDSLKDYTFKDENLEGLHKLRFFELPWAKLGGNLQDLLQKLRWFSWHGCPSVLKATNLSMNNLVILDLTKSEISECWAGWNQLKILNNLKVLDLTGCENLRETPDFSGFKALERLILQGCYNLSRIDGSIRNLKSLKYLNAKGCCSLEGLPEEISYLEDLEEIRIQGKEQPFYLPQSIGNLKSLMILKFAYLRISELPSSIGGLAKLEYLSLVYCPEIKTLPDLLGDLKSLMKLKIAGSGITKLPDSIGGLVKLELLVLRECEALESLPHSIGSLKSLVELDALDTKITEFPDYICGLVKLERLSLFGTCRIPEFLGNLESLVELKLFDVEATELPESIGDLKLLKTLDISNSKVRQLPSSIKMLKKLQVIQAEGSSLCEVPSEINAARNLKVLNLSSTKIHGLPQVISHLSFLQELHLIDCNELQELPRLPTSLAGLFISSMSLRDIPNLSNCINLKQLMLSCGCESSVDWNWIGRLAKLESLTLKVSDISSLPDELNALSRLDYLHLQCCDLQHLPNLPSNLSWLILSDFKGELRSNLSYLKNLEVLQVFRCEMLVEIPGLGELESLHFLEIDGCNSLQKLQSLLKLKNMFHLKLYHCSKLADILGMEDLEALTGLYIKCCPSLERVPSLFRLRILQRLKIESCDKLSSLYGLEELESLTELHISNCGSLRRMAIPRTCPVQRISFCEELIEVRGLPDFDYLEKLNYKECISIERLVIQQNFSNCSHDDDGMKHWLQIDGSGSSSEDIDDNLSKLTHMLAVQFRKYSTTARLTTPFMEELLFESSNVMLEIKPPCCSLEITLASLSKSQSLESLELQNCDKLSDGDFKGLGALKSLKLLFISYCDSLKRLLDVPVNLRVVYIESCKNLIEVGGSKGWQTTEWLEIRDCSSLERLANVVKWRNLKQLTIENCENLLDINVVGEIKNLQKLMIRGCDLAMRLCNLSKLKKLEEMCIENCKMLKEVRGVGELTSLQKLKMINCESLERLTGISKLKSLRDVEITDCERLRDIIGFEILESLMHCSISGCRYLESLPQDLKIKGLYRVEESEGKEEGSSEEEEGDESEGNEESYEFKEVKIKDESIDFQYNFLCLAIPLPSPTSHFLKDGRNVLDEDEEDASCERDYLDEDILGEEIGE